MNELYHYGVKGMKWGIRKERQKINRRQRFETTVVLRKKNESVELHQNPESRTAAFLAKIIPSVAENQKVHRDYTIKDNTGTSVGTMTTRMDPNNTMNIVWLSIKSKNGGKGYGQSAMRTIVSDAKKHGIKRITLEVPTTSPNARHIYEKIGFKATGEAMLGDKDDVWGGLTKMQLKLK